MTDDPRLAAAKAWYHRGRLERTLNEDLTALLVAIDAADTRFGPVTDEMVERTHRKLKVLRYRISLDTTRAVLEAALGTPAKPICVPEDCRFPLTCGLNKQCMASFYRAICRHAGQRVGGAS